MSVGSQSLNSTTEWRRTIAAPTPIVTKLRHSAVDIVTPPAFVGCTMHHLRNDVLNLCNKFVEEHNRRVVDSTPHGPPQHLQQAPVGKPPAAETTTTINVPASGANPSAVGTVSVPRASSSKASPANSPSRGGGNNSGSRSNRNAPVLEGGPLASGHVRPLLPLLTLDRDRLSVVVDALRPTDVAQLLLRVVDVVLFHNAASAAALSSAGGASTPHGSGGVASRVFDPQSLHSPMIPLVRSPWLPQSPAPQPQTFRPPTLTLNQLVQRGGNNTSTESATGHQLHQQQQQQQGGGTSLTPSSLNTSSTSIARPTPKMTRQLVQVTDSEGFTTINNYVLLEEAGAGRFGKVCVASVIGTAELRAIKIIAKSRLRQRWQQLREYANGDAPEDHMLALHREVAIMKRLRHKNVVPLYEVIDDPDENAMYLVMKYIEKGPIVRLDSQWNCLPLDIDMVRCIARQTASGVAYLHRHRIAHRDIKPDNILLGDDGAVYLSDFGVSQIFENDDHVSSSDGTPAYAAPEIVRGVGEFSAMKADIWALGVTLYTLLFGKAPFYAPSIYELSEKIINEPLDFRVRGDMNADVDYDDAIDMLQHMLERDVERRITAAGLAAHPFVASGKRKHQAANTVTAPVLAMPELEPPLPAEGSTSLDSMGELTAEETMTAFTPMMPKPPGTSYGGTSALLFRRDWKTFD